MELPNIVVGREKDLEALKMQFDTLLEGRGALAVIAGDTGIGKTTLVKKALADLALVDGTCIYAKFEQYKGDKPYLTVIQILAQLSRHMLTLPDDKLNRIRMKLVQKLGKDRAFISWMVPEAQGILGQAKEIQVISHRVYRRCQGIISAGYRCG